jgi:26S proteasome regulatory subunit N1
VIEQCDHEEKVIFIPQVEELSEEDQEIKSNLELMVERVQDPEPGVSKLAIQSIANEIRSAFSLFSFSPLQHCAFFSFHHPSSLTLPPTPPPSLGRTATSSMTSVPKPLKFLYAHYATLQARADALPASDPNRAALADVVSVLAMTSAPEGSRHVLKYRLLGGGGDVAAWGHGIRPPPLWRNRRREGGPGPGRRPVGDLMRLVEQAVAYNMAHNTEPEAVDLLLEVDALDMIVAHIDAKNAGRTALYLLSCAPYLPEPDNASVLRAARAAYTKVGRHADALRVDLKLGDLALAAETFAACDDPGGKKQLAHIFARHGVVLDLDDGPAAVDDDDLKEQLQVIMRSVWT